MAITELGGQIEHRPAWQLRDVRLSGAGRALVDMPDLAIAPDRTTVIMGANGAGKTLLLRVLHGLSRPDHGMVLWQGRALDADGRRDQAMVFQRPVVLRRSVLGNVSFALAARGIAGAERRSRAGWALQVARLQSLSARPARRLSGGEQQRLAVACALACRPKALLLDEPTASLDPASTAEIERLIAEARSTGMTVLLVTHDQGQARRLGDDLVFLHAGRVVESGRAADILDAPQSPAAQAWLSGQLYL